MKKLLFLFSIILLSSCTCLIGQIPPQFLIVDQTCGAAMPDYLTKIRVTDNCEIDTVWQSPTRGTWLTQPANNAMIGLLISSVIIRICCLRFSCWTQSRRSSLPTRHYLLMPMDSLITCITPPRECLPGRYGLRKARRRTV